MLTLRARQPSLKALQIFVAYTQHLLTLQQHPLLIQFSSEILRLTHTLEIVVKESPMNARFMMKVTVVMAHAKMNFKE
jgi:hypothetical protein